MAAYDTIPERNVSRDETRRDETRRDERVWLIGEGFTENLIEIAMKRRGGQIVIYMHSPDTPSITRQDSNEESS